MKTGGYYAAAENAFLDAVFESTFYVCKGRPKFLKQVR
jgi:hypothetical protein